MDAKQFEQDALDRPPIRLLLQAVSEEVSRDVLAKGSRRYVSLTGGDLLFSIAAYALYRWVKDYFDQRRALQESELVKQQAQVIMALTEAGFPPKLAHATTVSLLKHIALRTKDDPALTSALKLMAKRQ